MYLFKVKQGRGHITDTNRHACGRRHASQLSSRKTSSRKHKDKNTVYYKTVYLKMEYLNIFQKRDTKGDKRVKFKDEFSERDRSEESAKILEEFPDRIPIILEQDDNNGNSNSLGMIDKRKYLVPRDLTVGQFIWTIRKRLELSSSQAIFIFVGGGEVPASSAMLSHIYEDYKDRDGFLYITYTGENTFG